MHLLFLALISFSYVDAAKVFEAQNPQGRDQTELYLQLSRDPSFSLSKDDMNALKKMRVVQISGFLSNVSHRMKSLLGLIFTHEEAHAKNQKDWLAQNGIPYTHADVESEGSTEINIPLIEKAVTDSPEPVILLTHSKGGVDTLLTLLKRPDLRQKVRGWISVQAPFYGTPLSDYWLQSKKFQRVADRILKNMGGSIECLKNLSMQERHSFISENQSEIDAIQREIPVISFGSWKDDIIGKWDTVFEPYFRDQMATGGLETDGVVPWKSTILPGSSYIAIEGVDHLQPIGAFELERFDRVKFLQALLHMLLHKDSF